MGHVLIRSIVCSALLFSAVAWSAEGEKPTPCCATTEMLVNTCVGCHGPAGSSKGPSTPHLAEMSPNYFIGAMLAYKYDNDPDSIDTVLSEDQAVVGEGGITLEEVEKFERVSTVMGRLAKGYTLKEIIKMAKYFAEQKLVAHPQEIDAAKAKKGQKLHKKYCEKCHEDGGSVSDDDAGILAGQWIPYLRYAMDDYLSGTREMPKKMSKQLKDMRLKKGHATVEELIHFYASRK